MPVIFLYNIPCTNIPLKERKKKKDKTMLKVLTIKIKQNKRQLSFNFISNYGFLFLSSALDLDYKFYKYKIGSWSGNFAMICICDNQNCESAFVLVWNQFSFNTKIIIWYWASYKPLGLHQWDNLYWKSVSNLYNSLL